MFQKNITNLLLLHLLLLNEHEAFIIKEKNANEMFRKEYYGFTAY